MKLKQGMEEDYKKYVEVNSEDDYSKGIVIYGEKWAELMEEELEKGRGLEEVAKETSHSADEEGITGFMYGCAVSALAHFWEHGEELRRWNNLDQQLGNEGEKANESGGVLNPALLTIEEG